MQEEKNSYRKNVIHIKNGERSACNKIFVYNNYYADKLEDATCKVCIFTATGNRPEKKAINKQYSSITARIKERIAELETSLELSKKLLESYENL